MINLQNLLLYFFIFVLIFGIIGGMFLFVLKIYEKKESLILGTILFFLMYITLALGIVSYILLNFLILIAISYIIYTISKLTLSIFTTREISTYISLLIVFIVISYFDKFVMIIHKYILHRHNESNGGFYNFIKLINMRLGINLIATLIIILSSIEKISGKIIISNNTWHEITPYILEAIVTFLALDAFLSMINKSLINGTKTSFANFVTSLQDFMGITEIGESEDIKESDNQTILIDIKTFKLKSFISFRDSKNK